MESLRPLLPFWGAGEVVYGRPRGHSQVLTVLTPGWHIIYDQGHALLSQYVNNFTMENTQVSDLMYIIYKGLFNLDFLELNYLSLHHFLRCR